MRRAKITCLVSQGGGSVTSSLAWRRRREEEAKLTSRPPLYNANVTRTDFASKVTHNLNLLAPTLLPFSWTLTGATKARKPQLQMTPANSRTGNAEEMERAFIIYTRYVIYLIIPPYLLNKHSTNAKIMYNFK